MPETTMNVDYRFVFSKYDIRFPWQCLRMESKSKALREQKSSNENLGLSVLRPDSAHIETSNVRFMNIPHTAI